MQQPNYDHLMKKIKALPLSEQLLILEQTAALVRSRTSEQSQTRSILELKGKGKDIWKQVDVSQYLEEERASWTG